MPSRVTPDPSLNDALATSARPLAGMWVCSGSDLVAEICAGAGLDAVVVDGEHGPNGIEGILAQLQAVRGHPVTAVVRPPVNGTVVIKQNPDLGVQSLLVPIVQTAVDAEAAVAAAHYPPRGVRGVGSALARGSEGLAAATLWRACRRTRPASYATLATDRPQFQGNGFRDRSWSSVTMKGRM